MNSDQKHIPIKKQVLDNQARGGGGSVNTSPDDECANKNVMIDENDDGRPRIEVQSVPDECEGAMTNNPDGGGGWGA